MSGLLKIKLVFLNAKRIVDFLKIFAYLVVRLAKKLSLSNLGVLIYIFLSIASL